MASTIKPGARVARVATARRGLALLLLLAGARAAGAQAIDTAAALGALRDYRQACEAEAGRLWGASLCGPVALVDRGSRLAVATEPLPGRAWVPLADAVIVVLPDGVPLANTSVTFGDRRFATVLLPLPADRFARLALVAHEAFHREQEALGLPTVAAPAAHLDEGASRRWLRLELRALAAALETTVDAAARRRVQDALLFRHVRHGLVPGADTLERQMEMHEGLSEYTGYRLALDLTGAGPARVAREVRAFERRPSYVRSFAYATGPALGVLLDRFAPRWREEVRARPDPAALLAQAVGWSAPARSAEAAERRAAAYDGATVAAEEARRDEERRRRADELRARLVDGPTLVVAHDGLQSSFDPNTLVPFGELGTVFPAGTFMGPWGRLVVERGGALVSPDWSRLVVPAPASVGAPVVEGDGWRLELAQGWIVRPTAGRPGSYEVTRTP